MKKKNAFIMKHIHDENATVTETHDAPSQFKSDTINE